jgi:hypothetical protein
LSQETAIRESATKLDALKGEMDELAPGAGRRPGPPRCGPRAPPVGAGAGRRVASAQHSREIEPGLGVRQGVKDAQAKLDELTAATVAGVEDRINDLKNCAR